MGCSVFVGIVVVLLCLSGGIYTGWAAQGAYQKAKKEKEKLANRLSPPKPPSASRDMGGNRAASAGGYVGGTNEGAKITYKRTPRPGDTSAEMPTSDSMLHWYQVHDDTELLTSEAVHEWLGALAESGRVELDPNLHSYTHELLSYLRMQSPNLLQMLRRFKQTGGTLPPLQPAEIEALGAVLTVDNILNFSKAPDDRHMLILAHIVNVDKSKDTDGSPRDKTTSALSLDDVNLTPKDMVERDFGVTLNDSLVKDPREQLERFVAKQRDPSVAIGPYDFFPKICVPTIWHVLQYSDEDHFTAPGNAYWQNDKPALDLMNCANKHFEEAGLPLVLTLGEWRSDVNQYPYLNLGTFEEWQQCADKADECTKVIAEKHNVDVTEVLNIYTVGTATCEHCCSSCASGYVSHLGDAPTEEVTWQHLAMSWDRVDPDVDNSVRSNNKGCGTFTHEVGHLFGGLYHTHTGNCSDGDKIIDTPANMDGNTVEWRSELSQWCSEFVKDGNPDMAQLDAFDSCKGDEYIDNVFNFMSYNPAACRMLFTTGQVQHFLASMYAYRPKLLRNSRCVNLS